VITTAAPTRVARELQLRAAPSELVTARRFVQGAAARFGFDEKKSYAFTFAANEAVTNAIEHGRPSPEGTIRLYVVEENGALVFYVEDYGTFAPDAAQLEVLPARGRGLAFMAAMVDEVEVRQGQSGTVIRLCKHSGSS